MPTDTQADRDTPDNLRLALEAAEAATDAAAEVNGLRRTAETALGRLDRSAGRIGPLMAGCLAGSVAVLVLGGLFHLRTLADMRTTTAAQIEALALFSTRIGTLDAQLAAVAAMTEGMAGMADRVAALETAVAAAGAATVAEVNAHVTAEATTTRNAASQGTAGLLDAIGAAEAATTAAVTAGASDLQLALSRMLAAGLGGDAATARPAAAAAPPAAPAPAPRPAAAPRTAAATPANPFSYP